MFHERGLAAPIGPYECDMFPFPEVEGEPVENRDGGAFVAMGEILYPNHVDSKPRGQKG